VDTLTLCYSLPLRNYPSSICCNADCYLNASLADRIKSHTGAKQPPSVCTFLFNPVKTPHDKKDVVPMLHCAPPYPLSHEHVPGRSTPLSHFPWTQEQSENQCITNNWLTVDNAEFNATHVKIREYHLGSGRIFRHGSCGCRVVLGEFGVYFYSVNKVSKDIFQKWKIKLLLLIETLISGKLGTLGDCWLFFSRLESIANVFEKRRMEISIVLYWMKNISRVLEFQAFFCSTEKINKIMKTKMHGSLTFIKIGMHLTLL